VIVAEGPLNSLDFYWQTIGAKQWNARVVAGWFTTYSAPTVVSNGDSSQIVAEGPDHSLKFYWQQNSTVGWHAETVAGQHSTYSAPDIIANPGNLNVVAQGPGNTLRRYWQQDGTAEWHPQTVTGWSTVLGPPSITFEIRKGTPGMRVVDQSVNDFLVGFFDDNAAPTWKERSVATGGFAESPATATSNQGSENIAVAGPDGFLYFYYETQNGTFFRESVDPPTL
jgi:hypothetical protein